MTQLTPEEYQKLLDLGGQNTDLEHQVAMQIAQAQMMRKGNAPQMHDAGRLTVAPHWMELLGGLARERAGQVSQNKAMDQQKQMTANTQMQNALILRGLSGQQPQAVGADPQAGGGMGLRLPQPRGPYSFGGQ